MAIPKIPKKYIRRLNINGLSGRVLELPKPRQSAREVVLVYGHHSSLERMYSIAKTLNEDAGVIMPDLPGFGGMDSMYRIGMQPTIDNLADYLATYLRLRFGKRKHFSLGGMSYGFVIITRMLQKYPEFEGQIDVLMSIAGFSDYTDFKFSKKNFGRMKRASSLFSRALPAAFVKYVALNPLFIRLAYRRVADTNPKLRNESPDRVRDIIEFEVVLWRCNDVRTYMATAHSMFLLRQRGQNSSLTLHHVVIEADQYFNNKRVIENLQRIYPVIKTHESPLKAHAPTIIDETEHAAQLIPQSIRELLRR